MKQTLPGALPIPLKQRHRLAAASLFATAIIICSLTVRATPGDNQPDGNAIAGQCIGVTGAQIANPFSNHYTCKSLGPVPGLPTSYGGLTFKYDDSNTVLIGGGANDSTGRIYQITVTRDANQHITGFSGTATPYPRSTARIGQYNDGGVAFGPDNVLFVTHYPTNQLEQSKAGSAVVNKLTDLAAFGVTLSAGSLAFVPQGFPGAGSMKLVSFPSGDWYNVDYSPDGNGTFNIHSAALRTNIGGAEGIAFVPQGSPAFALSSYALIAKYSSNTIIATPLDTNGDPIVANSQSFMTGIVGPEGAAVDPVTGDFLISTSGTDEENKVVRVSGFAVPPQPAPPIPTPARCGYRIGIVFVNPSGLTPSALGSEISTDPDVASVGTLTAGILTPTFAELQQYDVVVLVNNGAFGNPTTLGDNLADYVDAGGVVVESPYGFYDTALGVKGRWLTGNYSPFSYTLLTRTGPFDGAVDDPEHRHQLMAGVTTLKGNFILQTALAPGATRVASVTQTGDLLVAYRPVNGGHTTVGITAYLGDANRTGDWGRLIMNAARWLRPCRVAPTPAPTATPTATATATPAATATATATPAATATATTTPAATATPNPTATATASPAATAVPSPTPTATPTPNSHLANISTRMRVEAGDNVLIAGFIIQGDTSKRILVRGVGPSLATFGIAGPLQDRPWS